MKPTLIKKLTLNRETIQVLTSTQLGTVAGGAPRTVGQRCANMTLEPACPPEQTPLCPDLSRTCIGCNPLSNNPEQCYSETCSWPCP